MSTTTSFSLLHKAGPEMDSDDASWSSALCDVVMRARYGLTWIKIH